MTKPTAAERFNKYIEDNPHVPGIFLKLARQYRNRFPGEKVGIDVIRGQARWHAAFTVVGSEFKFPNEYSPCLARWIMRADPSLQGLFDTKRSRADQWLDELAD